MVKQEMTRDDGGLALLSFCCQNCEMVWTFEAGVLEQVDRKRGKNSVSTLLSRQSCEMT